MSKIYVRKDGLYKDGKKLQLIFGDPEQVAAIRRYEKRMLEFENGTAEPSRITYSVEATMYFTCVCDNYSFDRTVDADDEDDVSCFAMEKFECPKCQNKFEAEYDYKKDAIRIQLKPFNKKNV